MLVHHLNCGSMVTPTAPMVCHVLLAETANGLVLIDTGFGLRDCADPRRLGPLRHVIRPVLNAQETAARQVEGLGFERKDVRHIVITHFDFDHIGGLADFPDAQIHLTTDEASGSIRAQSLRERLRFRAVQWAHGPKLTEHTADGELWRGFASAKELSEIAAGIALIPLPGHSRGHACVAVDAGHRWILHCGDAFYHHGTLDGSTVPRSLTATESAVAFDRRQVRANHARLAELYGRAEPDLMMVNAHDPALFEQAHATA